MSGIIHGIAGANLTLTSVSGFLSSSAVDVIGVYDQGFNQLFAGARPIKASIKETAKLMTHPVESGYVITDHRVIEPIGITLNIIVDPTDYYDTYQQVKQAYLGVVSLVVQTRTGSYPNMYIASMPHEETGDMLDTISMIIELTETLIVQSSTSTVSVAQAKNPVNSPTVSKGSQQGTAATPSQTSQTQSSVAYDAFQSGKGFF